MEEISKILKVEPFEPFIVDGSRCVPVAYEDGYFVPDGWQEHLTERGIEFIELENGTE